MSQKKTSRNFPEGTFPYVFFVPQMPKESSVHVIQRHHFFQLLRSRPWKLHRNSKGTEGLGNCNEWSRGPWFWFFKRPCFWGGVDFQKGQGQEGALGIYIYIYGYIYMDIYIYICCVYIARQPVTWQSTQSGDMKWGFFDWGCVSTRHNSTPNPNGRCDVSKDHPFLFISLIGGFDEHYFSPTSLPSLQQSLIT